MANKKQDPRVTKIIDLVRAFNGDTKIPKEDTLAGLEEIGTEVDGYIDCLREELG
jgi:hypothetical protein